jgi:PAS domain S-box-containing protein
MTFSLRGIAWAAFAVAVVLLVGSSIFLFRATQRLNESDDLVAHTHEVQAALENLGSEIYRATNSRRGFIITGDESLLQDYRAAVENIPKGLDRVRQLTTDSDTHLQLDSVATDTQNLLAVINRSLLEGERGTSSSEREIDITRQTAAIGDRIQRSLQKMRDEQEQLLAGRQGASHRNYLHTLDWITTSLVIALVLLLAEMILLSYEFYQHQRTESAARHSQEIVDAFFSSSTVGFGILDSEFRYTRFNDVLPRMAGLNHQELLGKSVSEVFGERGMRADTVLREVLLTGKPVLDREVSAELPGRPGDLRHWLMNYFPIREDQDKAQVGIIAVDVTARRKAEEALRKLSGRLLGIQDQERRRIARELHDSLGQYLAGLKIAIEMLSNAGPGKNEVLLAECNDILDKSIAETRTLSHLLHPPLLDEAGFSSAASWFVSGFSQRSSIPVSLDLPSDLPRLPESIEIALFRILQESLTNVHRHSRATAAEIKVEADAEQVSIEIRDHGRGMPAYILQQIEGDGTKLGVGLAGMRERIHELGGSFEVVSDAQGTTVRAAVPLGAREDPYPLRARAEHSA